MHKLVQPQATIDRAVRETGRVNAEGVELIRTAMNNTIGEYCE